MVDELGSVVPHRPRAAGTWIVAAISLVLSVGGVSRAQSVADDFNPGASAIVYALALQPDGKILIGGGFTTVGGGGAGTPRPKLARLDADGSVDATFSPAATGIVYALALQPDGKILVGGIFPTLGGTTRQNLGRVNADGSLDTSFNPGANGAVFAFALQPDGKILVGGDFNTLGGGGTGTTARNRIGRLNTDGSLDTTFDPGANAAVLALELQPDGRILTGGYFTTLGGGGTGTTARNHVGRLNGDGSLDTSFDPGADGFVTALAVQPDGKIVVGGEFAALGGGGFGTSVRNYIGRLNLDGSLDTSFNPSANGSVNVLSLQPDGRILVGGSFTTLAGTARDRIGRLDTDGALDTSLDPGANNAVTRLARQPDGKIVVAGNFTALAGAARNRIGRVYGSLDAPTATSGNITVTEDTPSSGTLSASDPDSPALTFSIVANGSKGTAVVTNAATGTFNYTPNANATGGDSFTFKANDGHTDSNVATISVSITPVDDAPTIGAIANQTIDEDQSTGALAFTVGDIDTSNTTWSVSAASSDTTLVPPAGIVLGGLDSSGNRTIAVTPAADRSGTATITVTFSSEAGSTAMRSFTVTVNPDGDGPTISAIPNQTIDEDNATGALAFTVDDIDTSNVTWSVTAAASDTTLVPPGSIALGGLDSSSSRTITVTPAADQSGTATISVTFSSEAGSTATRSFTVTVNPVNDAPTVTAIANQTIDEDHATSALVFTVGDVDTGNTTWSVSAASSDTTLVPHAGLVLGGLDSSGNRTITVTPAADQSGTATITVTFSSEAGSTATRSFTVTVNAVDDAPTITAIANQTLAEDQATGALAFTVGDVEGSSLTVTATSSNPALVPNGSIGLGGSGANRSALVTPAADRNGTASITLTVNDGALTASTTFTVTVTAVDDAPSITAIANQTIDEDTITGALAFTVNDADGGTLSVTASSSNATLVPAADVAVTGSGANRSVSVSPAADRSGTTIITMTVSDGALTTSTAFNVSVTAVNDPPTLTAAADTTTSRNAPVTIAFTVDDIEGGAGAVTLTGASSNSVLVRPADLVFGGTAANRTLTISPGPGVAGVTGITVTASDGALTASRSFLLTVGTGAYAPFAEALTGGATPIRAVHVTELRSRIDAVRTSRGLAAFTWTDPALAAGTTPMKAVHITQLRTAVNEAHLAAGRSVPIYTDAEIIPGVTTIKAAHLEEIRSAVIALE